MPLIKLSLPLSPPKCLSLIGSYTRTKSLRSATQLHGLLITSAFIDPLLTSRLAALYSLSGDTLSAHRLFDKIPHKTVPLFNALIRGHVQNSHHSVALQLFAEMFSLGLCPDNFTFPFALKACGELQNPQSGSQIHCSALISGHAENDYVQNCLIAMYMNCAQTEAAAGVFDKMHNKGTVSWNSMISGLLQNGQAEKALDVFDRMVDGGRFEVDRATAVSVLPACAQLKDLRRGRMVHQLAVDLGFATYLPVTNSLIDMYAKCGSLEEARRVFNDCKVVERDVISWTSMISGYALNGCSKEALELSYRMQASGIRPNTVTFTSLLSACGVPPTLHHGKCVHGSCIRLGVHLDITVETALIDMYSNCGTMDFGVKVFAMGSRRTATWNAVISGFTRNEQTRNSIEHFRLMLAEGVSPDLATIASVLPAFSHRGDLCQAKNVHSYLTRTGFLKSIEVSTSLIDVYAKVGCLETAQDLFDALLTKDFVCWSAIIGGYGMHGHARTAIWLLDRMVESGIEPNEVTFTSVLYSCSHAGLVDEGLQVFERMVEASRLTPHNEHYACIVDILGRAGRLREAYGVITSMPFEANHTVWGALLGACAVHGDVELGEVAAGRLFEVEPENTGNYVLLANMYAAVGRWEDAENLRRMVGERGLRKAPGCTLIEAKNV